MRVKKGKACLTVIVTLFALLLVSIFTYQLDNSHSVNYKIFNSPSICVGGSPNGILEQGEECDSNVLQNQCTFYNNFTLNYNSNFTKGLVAYYSFENNFNDLSGLGNNGVGYNVNFSSVNSDNNVANFNGVNGYIEIPNSASMNPQNMSISFWINPDQSLGLQQLIRKGSYAQNDYNLDLRLQTTGWNFGYKNTFDFGSIIGGSTESYGFGGMSKDNKWHHVVYTRDTVGVFKIYIDGVISGSIDMGGYFPSYYGSTNNIWIGSNYPSQAYLMFKGQMDNLMIYNRSLPINEVTTLYRVQNKSYNYYYSGGNVSCKQDCTIDFGSCSICAGYPESAICPKSYNPSNRFSISILDANETVFLAPINLTLMAEMNYNEVGSLRGVTYYDGNGIIGENYSTYPYSLKLNNPSVGRHVVKARANTTYGTLLTEITIDVLSSASTSYPVALYKFSSGNWNSTFGEIKDSSGYGFNGKAVSSAKIGKRINEGIDGYSAGGFKDPWSRIDIANFTIPYGQRELTLSLWYKLDALPNGAMRLMEHFWTGGADGGSFTTHIVNNSGQYYIQGYFVQNDSSTVVAGSTPTNTNPFQLGKWNQFAITYKNGSVKAYSNGINVGSATGANLPLKNRTASLSFPFVMGNFPGEIDEVSIYLKALSSEEISLNYNDESSRLVIDPSRRIVAKYSFEENFWNQTAYEIVDSSGYGNSGRSGGANMTLNGVVGKAANFNGSTFINLSNYSEFNLGKEDRTFSFWVKGDSRAGMKLFAKSNVDSFENGYGIWTSPALELKISNGTSSVGGLSVNALDGTWHHIVFAISRYGYSSSYKDGILVSSVSGGLFPGQDISNNNALYLGKNYPDGGWFNGSIDEFTIFDRVLNSSEVLKIYTAEKVNLLSSGASLRTYYKFDEETLTNNTGAITDSSGFNNHASINNITNVISSYDSVSGRAIIFNGTNYIYNSKRFIDSNKSFSVSFWMKVKGFNGGGPMLSSINPNGVTGDWYLRFANGNVLNGNGLSFAYANNFNDPIAVQTTSLGLLNLNNWYHIAIVWNGSTRFIYINGTNIPLSAPTPFGAGWNVGQEIGRIWNGPSYAFNGSIDEIMFFEGALGSTEVRDIYNRQNTVTAICKDSDDISVSGNGKNYYLKGNTSTNYIYPGKALSLVDSCKDTNTLTEAYCSENFVVSEDHICQFGCSEGRCITNNLDEKVISSSRLSEIRNTVNLSYTFSVSQEEYSALSSSLTMTLKTPSGISSVNLNRISSGNTCYVSTSGTILCSVEYIGAFAPNKIGAYYLRSGNNNYFVTYAAKQGIVDSNVIKSPTPLNITGDYEESQGAIVLNSHYELTKNNMSDVSIFIYPNNVSASIYFDSLLSDLKENNVNSPVNVGVNLVYLFKFTETRGDEYIGALWRSNDTILFFTFSPEQGYATNISSNDLANALLGNQVTFKESAKISNFDANSYSLLVSYVNKFKSSLSLTELACIPDWSCNIVPTICPEHGLQTKECTDNNKCQNRLTSTIECTPGICSGCQLDDYSGKCIPYGFRLSSALGEASYCEYTGEITNQKGDNAECNNGYECFSGECNSGYCVNTHITSVQNANLLRKIWCKMVTLPVLGGAEEDYLQCLGAYG